MAQIFISYATEDRERAKLLAQLLEERGWSTWWDRKIPLGRPFDAVIEEAIAAARCVIVLWSAASVASEWVRTEASEAKRLGILVPVFLEEVPAPLAFRLLNGANLIGWRPGSPHPEFDKLTERVAEFLTPAGPTAPPPRLSRERPEAHAEQSPRVEPGAASEVNAPLGPRRRRLRFWLMAALGIPLALGAILFWALTDPPRPPRERQGADRTDTALSALPQAQVSVVEPPTNQPVKRAATASPNEGKPAGVDVGLLKNTLRGFNLSAIPVTIEKPEDVGLVLSFAVRQRPGAPKVAGALVEEVRDGWARQSGVRVGDLITEVNGTRIDSQDSLRRAFHYGADGRLRIRIQRDNGTLYLELSQKLAMRAK